MARKRRNKFEFSKILLFADYSIFAILVICDVLWGSRIDLTAIVVAWVAQLGVSSAAYYIKAKSENLTKVPLKVIENLPPEMQEKINLTEVIVTLLNNSN